MAKAKPALHFLPLGGAGEIGMNLNLYEYDGAWLMCDLGITFVDLSDADAPTNIRGLLQYSPSAKLDLFGSMFIDALDRATDVGNASPCAILRARCEQPPCAGIAPAAGPGSIPNA